jgi:predicted nuclease of predicted toxin-antitoxin system
MGVPPSNVLLLQRLDAFLPRIRKANDDLATHIATHGADAVNIEAVAEEEAHILMVRCVHCQCHAYSSIVVTVLRRTLL